VARLRSVCTFDSQEMNSPTWPVKAATAKIEVYGLPR
jgi:hypothetical protein